MNSNPILTDSQVQATQIEFINKVYSWMAGALIITGLVAYYVADTPSLIYAITSNQILFFGLMIGELFLVGYLVTAIKRMTAQTASFTFIAFSVLNGLTLSIVFVAYTASSIASTFFITAGTFAVMSMYGYYTKKDLTSIGNLAFMGLIGLIIASVVNIFFQNEMLYWITTYAGVLIFVGLTAYDTQKIKKMSMAGHDGTEEMKKSAIMGALMLYLDFINLFLYLLRIFGNRR